MTTGLYPGSFDPPTLGHLDILQRAAAICSTLYVGIASNPEKQPFLAQDTRMELLQASCADLGLDNVEVVAISGATVTFARERGIDTLVRGLRSSLDLNAERGMAEINRQNGIDTLFLLARSSHSHLSSQLVRGVIAAGLSLDGLVCERVAAALAGR